MALWTLLERVRNLLCLATFLVCIFFYISFTICIATSNPLSYDTCDEFVQQIERLYNTTGFDMMTKQVNITIPGNNRILSLSEGIVTIL